MFFSGIEDGINNLNRMFCGNILNIKIGEKRRTNEDFFVFYKTGKLCEVFNNE